METPESLLEFPCDFPIKAMGRCDSGFEVAALEIVRRHVPGFDAARMYSRASSKGNYLSLTFVIPATSREQLDAIYRDLSGCDAMLMVL
jgi:putative lipoic acid-binding regulatory protein